MGRPYLLLITLGIAVGVTVWLMQTRQPPPVVANTSMEDDRQASESNDHYRQLNARLARLEALLAAGRPPLPSTTSDTALADPIAAEEQDQARTRRLQERYRSLFESDPRSNDAAKSEAVIVRAFSEPGVTSASGQPSTRTVQCRARVCMIAATFPPDVDASEWATRIPMALADGFGNSRVAWTTLPSGETAMALYLFKKGSEKMLFGKGI